MVRISFDEFRESECAKTQLLADALYKHYGDGALLRCLEAYVAQAKWVRARPVEKVLAAIDAARAGGAPAKECPLLAHVLVLMLQRKYVDDSALAAVAGALARWGARAPPGALGLVVRRWCVPAMRALLEMGADPCAPEEAADGEAPLLAAARRKSYDAETRGALLALVSKVPPSAPCLNAADAQGKTPFDHAAQRGAHGVEVARALMARGGFSGDTALMLVQEALAKLVDVASLQEAVVGLASSGRARR